MLDGKVISLQVRSTELIEDLKRVIAIKTGVPVDNQRFVFQGKHVDDYCKLGNLK
jgi:hypothetical protein